MVESLCAPSFLSKFSTWLGFQIVLLCGLVTLKINLWLGRSLIAKGQKKKGYANLLDPMKGFFYFQCYARAHDTADRPVASRPERIMDIVKRKRTTLNTKPIDRYKVPRRTTTTLNFSSYNYLGFSKPPPHCEKEILEVLRKFGVSSGGSRNYAYNVYIRDLEQRIAKFVGKEDCFIMGMGYATNSMVLSTLTGKGDLVFADKLSHSSSWIGMFHGKAEYHSFLHNNMKDLEKKIRQYMSQGQPGSTKDNIIPWRRIWVLFEGIYSMEGEFAPLDKIVELKKKYNLYLYMDEAHSMGGTGRTGRGSCEVHKVSPDDVEVMMGTFTKAFGAIGGYIAADRNIVQYLKQNSHGTIYGTVLPPAATSQVIQCHRLIVGEDGTDYGKNAIKNQRRNAIRLFKKLHQIGLEVVGQEGSPVMCIMLYNISKLGAFSRLAFKRGLALCIAGYPAVGFYENRSRVCVSAQHTKEDIDNCVEILSEVADLTLVKFKLPWYKRIWNLIA